MPRISKLSKQEIDGLISALLEGKSLVSIGLKYHIAAPSVFYYRKKFLLKLPTKPPSRPKRKVKKYDDYLREYYKKNGLKYKKPPQGKYLHWL